MTFDGVHSCDNDCTSPTPNCQKRVSYRHIPLTGIEWGHQTTCYCSFQSVTPSGSTDLISQDQDSRIILSQEELRDLNLPIEFDSSKLLIEESVQTEACK